MNGLIALVGSGEYLPVMEDTDRYLLDSLALHGRRPRVVCLPTAAGKEGDRSISRWSNMGVEHFEKLGADVQALRIIDRDSANDEQFEPIIESADLIYFSGGDPGYLYETMKDTCAWQAAQRAWQRGTIYAGCSAGAMILARRMPSFRLSHTQEGFGVVPAEYIVPHFNAIPGIWKPMLYAMQKKLKDGQRLLGVDEDTALVGSLDGEWKAMGKSSVHVFTRDGSVKYQNGDVVPLT